MIALVAAQQRKQAEPSTPGIKPDIGKVPIGAVLVPKRMDGKAAIVRANALGQILYLPIVCHGLCYPSQHRAHAPSHREGGNRHTYFSWAFLLGSHDAPQEAPLKPPSAHLPHQARFAAEEIAQTR